MMTKDEARQWIMDSVSKGKLLRNENEHIADIAAAFGCVLMELIHENPDPAFPAKVQELVRRHYRGVVAI